VTGENSKSEEALRLSARVGEAAGAELVVGTGLADLINRLRPKRVLRVQGREVIAGAVLRRLAAGEADDADLEYAKHVFGRQEARWLRRQQIEDRAVAVLERKYAALPAPDANSNAVEDKEIGPDWFEKFWDDAELVSDEVVQEIYAHVLAREVMAPGSSSMSALRVLRYMDPAVGQQFGDAIRIRAAFGEPDWLPNDDALMERFGITYTMILRFDDAGLLDSSAAVVRKFVQAAIVFVRYGVWVVALSRRDGEPFDVQWPIYLLGRGGRDLARVAEVERNIDDFFVVSRWLRSKLRGPEEFDVRWAEMRHAGYSGEASSLMWHDLPLDDPRPDEDAVQAP